MDAWWELCCEYMGLRCLDSCWNVIYESHGLVNNQRQPLEWLAHRTAKTLDQNKRGGTGDVAGAIESTWTDASSQIKTVVNKVVFPAIDLILAVFFFAKLGMAYFDYRKHGQFEWAAPAILFACLVFTLTAPTYIWTILGLWWWNRKWANQA